MDALMGAAIAGAAGAVSIVAAALLPTRLLDSRVLRLSGAVSIALMGAVALGVPMPSAAPLALLVCGLVAAFVKPMLRPAPAAQRP